MGAGTAAAAVASDGSGSDRAVLVQLSSEAENNFVGGEKTSTSEYLRRRGANTAHTHNGTAYTHTRHLHLSISRSIKQYSCVAAETLMRNVHAHAHMRMACRMYLYMLHVHARR